MNIKDAQIERLQAERDRGFEIIKKKDWRIAHLEAKEVALSLSVTKLEGMLEEAVRIFSLYLNTPETRALKERWEQLKKQP